MEELKQKQKAERDFISGKSMFLRTPIPVGKLKDHQTNLVAIGIVSTRLIGTYKGRTYRATVDRDGWVRYKGKKHPSLSAAGAAARKTPTNGWLFWKFKDKNGKWQRCDTLR
ncbi:MAG: DUF2924 domain-containing protein [Bdellovibrionaceae bacterium]|nr:DUF2924 domain-containing protein [Pseudobdellovibrionaceae bacterium]